MPTLNTGPFQTGDLMDDTTFNARLSPVLTAANVHNHDGADSTHGFGGSISSWGPSNSLYAAHGPGAGGTDWFSAYDGLAAIPGDPLETTSSPTAVIATATFKASGIALEIQRIRGQLAALTGSTWNATVSLTHLSPGSTDTGFIKVSGNIETTAGQFVSDVIAGTAPLAVTSTTVCTNLNADFTNGFHATSSYGAGNNAKLLALNAQGLYDAAAIAYDSAEAATLDTLTSSSTIANSDNRIRYQIAQLNIAAGGTTWLTAPATLVTSVTALGNPTLSGGVTFIAGSGVMFGQSGNNITISVTGSAPASGGSLTYADLFGDGVISGLTPTNPSGLNVQIATGTGYVGGVRRVMSAATTIAIPAVAGNTYYVFWDGTDSGGLTTNTTGNHQSGKVLLAKAIVNGGATAITLTDRRNFGLQATTPGVPISTAYGIVNVGTGYFTGHSGDSAFSGVAGGTGLAVNMAAGFAGNLADLQVAGARKASIDSTGAGAMTSLSLNSGSVGGPGDLGVARSPTTGAIFLDTSTSRFIYNDGSFIQIAGRNVTVGGHYESTGGTPTAGGLAAGISSIVVTGTDQGGIIAITTTGSPPAGNVTLGTINFVNALGAWSAPPGVSFGTLNVPTGGVFYQPTAPTTTAFTIAATVGLAASFTYRVCYTVGR